MEKRYYRAVALPEVLIVLKANPETAVKRKVDEDPNSVRARCTEIWELGWEETEAHVVDANRPKEEVLQELKSLLWAHL
jgi:thymidylate kinase